MAKFIEETWLSTEICCNCGMVFAMPSDFQRRRRDDHKLLYCPSGHKQHYTGATEAQKLQRKLEQREAELSNAQARANHAAAQRDSIAKAHKKMRVRISNGVCPCCNRSFDNLRQHMKTQHADYGSPSTLLALRTAFGMTQHQVADEAGVRAVAYVSNYEHGRPVPVEAKRRLDDWVDRQAASA